MPLEIAPLGTPRTVRVAGQLDLSNADDLAVRLEAEGAGAGDLIVDLSELTFIDSTGVRGLLRAAGTLTGRGNLVVQSPSPPVRRVLDLMGLANPASGLVIRDRGDRPEPGELQNAGETRSYDADRAMLTEVREFIRHRAARDSFAHWADGIVLAVNEACANAVLHSGSRSVRVTWLVREDRAEVEVRDDGTFRRAVPSDPTGSGSRGILLMMSVMDQVTISCGTDTRPGTVVRMVKYKNGRGASRQAAAGGPQAGPRSRSRQRVPS